jgi:Fe2+ transport system protein FeoA
MPGFRSMGFVHDAKFCLFERGVKRDPRVRSINETGLP